MSLVIAYIYIVSIANVLSDVHAQFLSREPPVPTGCSIDLNKDLTMKHPLILDPVIPKFILPNIKNGISFATGDKVHLACPGQSNHLAITSNIKEVIATCVADKTFSVNNNIGNKVFKDLSCKDYPVPSVKQTEADICRKYYTEVKIGFETQSGFIPLMVNCLDHPSKDTLYSKYSLTPITINNKQNKGVRPKDFCQGDFYNDFEINATYVYQFSSQLRTFGEILGSDEIANKYLNKNKNLYLSRGHLTPYADFIYVSQQRATCFFENAAPQWQTFNGGNWNKLEQSVRDLVATRNLNLIIFTGITGIASLPDVNNKLQQIYLYKHNNIRALNVPEIFWKIVHDPVAKTGTVFIGHNNPHEKGINPICADVSNRINWITWDANNVNAGYSYSCTFDEFKRIVRYLPDLPINGLLI